MKSGKRAFHTASDKSLGRPGYEATTGTLRNEYGFENLTTMNKIIGNLIRCDRIAQQEMIMGLDMNNVMDNNWILFCIWHVQLPFLWLSSHSYLHAYQTTPTECTCTRLTLHIRNSSCIIIVNLLGWIHCQQA